MLIFLLCLFLLILIMIIGTHNTILCNEIFWLLICWIFIIGVYYFSGVTWKYPMTWYSSIYIVMCFVFLMFGRSCGIRSTTNYFVRETSVKKTQLYTFLGVIGVLVFSFDYIRLNGFLDNTKSSYKISFIGSIGSLLVPILLVQGLYLFAITLQKTGKINIKALLMLGAYTIPCVLNSGRESLLYIVIGITAIFGYYSNFKKRKSFRYVNLKNFIRNIAIAILIILVFLIIVRISAERFGLNEINTYLYKHSISYETIAEAEKWGDFKFLYYNFISYFGHQIPFLEFILREYKGPYMFGMYEFNIISRRLPDFLGLDYTLVYSQLKSLYSTKGQSFSGSWQTVIGSFVIDFGRVGTPIICFICGVILGKVTKKYKKTYDLRYAILKALFCISMFSTIQLGPFYNTLVYGAYIWWIIIFGRDERQLADTQ